MPRVREEHFEAKRRQILGAARRVCETKPVHLVTMRDIVLESGMSQGGVYKYFAHIDAVYVALLNEAAPDRTVQADVEALLAGSASAEEKLSELLQYLGRYIESTVQSGGKVYFELMTLYSREPERFMAVREQLVEVSGLEFLQLQLHEVLHAGVSSGAFSPALPLEELVAFIRASIQGITQERIGAQYGSAPGVHVERLIAVLARSVRMLLGEGAKG